MRQYGTSQKNEAVVDVFFEHCILRKLVILN